MAAGPGGSEGAVAATLSESRDHRGLPKTIIVELRTCAGKVNILTWHMLHSLDPLHFLVHRGAWRFEDMGQESAPLFHITLRIRMHCRYDACII